MITFRKIKWKNLLSTGDVFTEIDLNTSKNVLIVGSNGSGKSTILDALCFVLFGKAFRNINKPTLVNTVNGKKCVVEVEFTTNNKEYKVVRGIKPTIFEIWCDGEMLNQDSSFRDYQEYLEKYVLKMNYKSFTQIVILGSASFTPFMQLSAADRRSVIEDLLDIQIFSIMNIIAKQRYQINKENIDSCRFDIRILEEKRQIIESTLEDLKQNNQSQIEQIQEELKNIQQQIGQCDKIIDKLENQQTELLSITKNRKTMLNTHKEMVKILNKIEFNIEHYRKDLKFYHDFDNCPTCKQSINSEFKAEMIESSKSKVSKFEENLDQLKMKIETINRDIQENDELLDTIADINAKITTEKRMKSSLKTNESNLENKLKVSHESDGLIQYSQSNLDVTIQELSDANDKLAEVITERSYLEMVLSLLKDGGIKTKIIKQYLPIINKQINKYLTAMDFYINFTLDENFEETIKSRYHDTFSYENFSEGEKMRIDLSLLFTWRTIAKSRNSASTNLLILDEIFDSSLDNNGTDEFLKIMRGLVDNTNVFVISHKGDQLMEKFDKVIRFEKIKSFSRIVE